MSQVNKRKNESNEDYLKERLKIWKGFRDDEEDEDEWKETILFPATIMYFH